MADVLALAGAGQSGCAEDDAGALDPELGTAVPEIRGEEHLDDPCSGARDPASSEDLPAYAGQEVTLPAEVTEVLSPRVSTVTSPDDAEVGEVLMTATEEAGDVEPQADEALVVAATAVDSLEAGGG